MHEYLHLYIHMLIYSYAYIFMYKYIYSYVQVYIFKYIFVYMYVYIYMHTYILFIHICIIICIYMFFFCGRLSVNLGEFPCRFMEYSFHICICFSRLTAFNFAIKVFFFLFTSFTVGHAIHNCLSSIEFLLLIWPYVYSSFLFCIS